MNRVLKVLALLVLATAVLCGCASTDARRREADLEAFTNFGGSYAKTVSEGDAAGYAAMWDEQGVKMHPNMPSIVGREQIFAFVEPRFGKVDQTMETVRDELIYAGDYIIARGHYTGTSTPKGGGPATPFAGKNLTVFKKQEDGSWKLYIDCYNSDLP